MNIQSKYEEYDFSIVKTNEFYHFFEKTLILKDAIIERLNTLEDNYEYAKCVSLCVNYLTETVKNLFYISNEFHIIFSFF